VASLYPPSGDEITRRVWVVRHDWHTGLVLRREDVPADAWPERDDFSGAAYLEVGWGERDFYQAPRGTFWLGFKAAFRASDSVLHVAGFSIPPAVYFAGAQVVEIGLSTQGFRALVTFIADAHARTGEGRAVSLGPGRYGQSQFYLGRERYALTTCNTWTARALRAGGFPITPFWAITAANVMFQVQSGRASPHPRSRWPWSGAEARRIQARLRHRISQAGGPRTLRFVAGAEVAYRRDGRRAWAAVVLVALPWHRLLGRLGRPASGSAHGMPGRSPGRISDAERGAGDCHRWWTRSLSRTGSTRRRCTGSARREGRPSRRGPPSRRVAGRSSWPASRRPAATGTPSWSR
jgi:uncharacterized protein (TIGR02117 family)